MARTRYSDRVRGPRPRTEEEITERPWGGLVAIVESGLAYPLFAEDYPRLCEDGRGVYACDEGAFRLALLADVPELDWPLDPHEPPETLVALDLVEFLYDHASAPFERDYHKFFGHHHLEFDEREGRRRLREKVNSVFARNGLAYELSSDGQVERLTPLVVSEQLRKRLPPTDDEAFNELLERAAEKFTSPDPAVRRDALEHAWDAFERAKTLLEPNKKRGARALVQGAANDGAEASLLEAEMHALTDIGNGFRIRHHETTTSPLTDELVDYLFARMYALMHRLHPTLSR